MLLCCIINTFAPGHWEKHLADLNGCNKILLGPTDIKNLFIIGYYPFILCIIGYCPFILYNIRQSRGAANRQHRFSTFTEDSLAGLSDVDDIGILLSLIIGCERSDSLDIYEIHYLYSSDNSLEIFDNASKFCLYCFAEFFKQCHLYSSPAVGLSSLNTARWTTNCVLAVKDKMLGQIHCSKWSYLMLISPRNHLLSASQ